jgi:hypothetical protein
MITKSPTVSLANEPSTVTIPRAEWNDLNRLAAESRFLQMADAAWRRLNLGSLRENLQVVIEMDAAVARGEIRLRQGTKLAAGAIDAPRPNQPHAAQPKPRLARSKARGRRRGA